MLLIQEHFSLMFHGEQFVSLFREYFLYRICRDAVPASTTITNHTAIILYTYPVETQCLRLPQSRIHTKQLYIPIL